MVADAAGLYSRVAACTDCTAAACRPVLSDANGPEDARIMFIGEAPGRLGAARTGVPFSGDAAGRRFEALLAEAGLTREEVFVTNAVLCLPLDAGGRNRPPTALERRNCSRWLEATIAEIQPELVVAMGRVALESLRAIHPHNLQLIHAAAGPVAWNGRRLAVLYHPGARSQVHRPWAAQLQDWRRIGPVARRSIGVDSHA